MFGIASISTLAYLLATVVSPTAANYVVIDTWGQEYCRSSYCALMDLDGWTMCCDRYKKCCAYAEYTVGRTKDPFAYETENTKTTTSTTTTTTTTTTTPAPVESDSTTDAETLGELPPVPPPLAPGLLQAGHHPMSSLRLSSLPQLKPGVDDLNGRNTANSNQPIQPNPNDVTYKLPPLPHNIEEMRQEEHQRESCRAKFCALMSVTQWNNCCIRFKNCCAYVSYFSYQDPFFYEKGPNDP